LIDTPNADLPPATVATVRSDSFLTLHYRLSADDGSDYVSTFDLSPATLQMGSGQLADSLENCLLGLAAGKRQVFYLAGNWTPLDPTTRASSNASPAARCHPEIELRVNSLIEFSSPDGAASFAGFLRELTDSSALFDFNHPLAGKPIRFEVEVIAIM
jgi:FKBP-type peptidyl-prolyl cis-trans isomerase SlpA